MSFTFTRETDYLCIPSQNMLIVGKCLLIVEQRSDRVINSDLMGVRHGRFLRGRKLTVVFKQNSLEVRP